MRTRCAGATGYRQRVVVLAVALLLSASPGCSPDAGPVRRSSTTVTFRPGLAFEVRHPAPTAEPPPVVVLVHGGSFIEGDRDEPHIAEVAAAFRRRGFATVQVDYRLGTEIPGELAAYAERTGRPYACDASQAATGREAPDDPGGPGRPCLVYLRAIARARSDVEAALRSLGHRGAELGVDLDRVALYGESAGSTVALSIALGQPRRLGIDVVVGVASAVHVPAGARSTVPLLLATYDQDLPGGTTANAEPVGQAQPVKDAAAALQAGGGDVELLVFAGPGHLPDPEDEPADFRRLVARSVARFDGAG